MNRFFRTATSLLMLSAVIACSDDSDSLNFGNETALKRVSITGADFLTENGARSSVNIDENGVHFLWNANDTVGIFPNKGGQVEFAMEKGVGMQTAVFNGGGWALKHSSFYSAYYPYNFYNRDLTKIPVNYTNQMQTGNNSTSHLGAYDFMAASVTTPANGAVAFDMQHMGALVKLQANFNKTKTLDRVLLKTHSDVFTTRGTIDLTAANPKITSQTKSDIFTVSLNDFTVAPDETCIIYFMMPPTDLSGETLAVLLYDEDGLCATFEVAGKNFVAGTAYSYTLTNEVGPIAKISDDSKIYGYWYAKNSNLEGYSDVHINAEIPGQPGANCEFTTDLKNTFIRNQLPDIVDLDDDYMYLTESGKMSVEFVEETELYTNVPGASGVFYNLHVSADGSKLLTTSNALVASITPDGVITMGQTPEAKDLLNHESHDKLNDKETLTVKIGFKYTTNDPVFPTITLENNTFYTKILRPISVTEGEAEIEDVLTNASRALVHFDFIDWRDRKFVDNDLYGSNYYSYYGLNSGAYVSIEPDMDNITTNMNNGTLGETKLSDITRWIRFRYEWDSSKHIKDHYFGELVYENNGSTVSNFKIQIPVKVHYTWGTIYTNIVAEVKKTINNANKK